MVKTIENTNITVDGNTVEILSVEPSEDYTELVAQAESPRSEFITVRWELKSGTPKDQLEKIFSGEYKITDTGTNHTLHATSEDTVAVYGNARLES